MLPNSRKKIPLFFFQKMFFYSLGDKCLTATPGGRSTPPPVGSPRQPPGKLRSREPDGDLKLSAWLAHPTIAGRSFVFVFLPELWDTKCSRRPRSRIRSVADFRSPESYVFGGR